MLSKPVAANDYWPRNAPPEPDIPDRVAVYIYQPSPSVTQSGRARRNWIMEFAATGRLTIEPLMGWTGSSDTRRQVQLSFPTKESAIAFARRQQWSFAVREPQRRRLQPKPYANNFRWISKSGSDRQG